jgi:staphylococcal nuclease domain-containing protein 1
LQRDVDIEVEAIDKNGTFLGTLLLPDKRNLAPVLLEAGLATLVQPAADRSTYASELSAAEATAKMAGLKVWENYSAEAEKEAAAAAAAAAAAEQDPTPDAQKQVVELTITEIVDGAHFYAHVAGDKSISALQEQLSASCRRAGGMDGKYDPAPGAMCCARFTVDDEWYRARVRSKQGGEYTVFFVDYGNVDVIKSDRLKPLDPTLSAQAISPQAVECRLAYLKVEPSDDDGIGSDAVNAFGEAIWNKPMLARVEDRDGGVLLVTLFDETNKNVNEMLIEEGLARVEKVTPRRAAPLVKALMEKEEGAKTKRTGMWRYGDIDEDEAPEFGFRRRP